MLQQALDCDDSTAHWRVEDFQRTTEAMLKLMNEDQKHIVEKLVNVIVMKPNESRQEKQKKLFFLEGAAGTGKTTVYKAMYYACRALGKQVSYKFSISSFFN